MKNKLEEITFMNGKYVNSRGEEVSIKKIKGGNHVILWNFKKGGHSENYKERLNKAKELLALQNYSSKINGYITGKGAVSHYDSEEKYKVITAPIMFCQIKS